MSTLASILQSQASAPTQGISITGSATVGGPLFWIGYQGDTDSGATVAVAAGGDMAFTTDGSTADTTVNGTGSIDLSTPAAAVDTMGELGDIINQSANWAFIFYGALRAGLTDNAILTVAAVDLSTAAKKLAGHFFFQDPAVVLATSLYGVPWAISGFDPTTYDKLEQGSLVDPDLNNQASLTYANVTSDFSAAGRLEFISCSQSADGNAFQIALTDNTVKEIGNYAAPIWKSKVGERLVVRVLNDQDAAANSTILNAAGYATNTRGDILNGAPLTNAAG